MVWILDSPDNLWCGPLIRTGLVMGALWWALPTKGRAIAWTNVSWVWIVAIAAALFLMTRASGFITGQLLPVNGGFVMN